MMRRKAMFGLAVLLLGCAVPVPVGSDGTEDAGVPTGDEASTDALSFADVKFDQKDGCFVYAGVWKTCVQAATGTVQCWGEHPGGTYDTTPASLPFPRPVVKMSIGEIGWWAILDDATLWYADGANKVPVQYAPAGSGVADVSIGDGHACIIKTGGQLFCWGRNDYGSVGDGTSVDRTAPVPVVVQGVTFSSVATSHLLTCALSTQGAAYCWGRNSFGQVGNAKSDQFAGVLSPTVVTGLGSGVVRIVTGTSHACALKSDGSVWCWGLDETGQIGNPTSPDSCPWTPSPYRCAKTPQKVAALGSLQAIEIAAGENHTCARGSDRTLWCWGNGSWGQIGTGSTPAKTLPTQIGVLGNQAAVGVTGGSASHTCARTVDGHLYCWGMNFRSEIGATTSSTCKDYYGGLSGACALAPILIGSITCLPPQGAN